MGLFLAQVGLIHPPTADAQVRPHTLVVFVVDSASGKPLGNATVRLRHGGVVATSSDSGIANFRIFRPGVDTIEVHRIGYSPLATTIVVRPAGMTEIVFELQPVVQLPPVEILEVERHRFLARNGFYDRKSRLRATFLGPEEIDRLNPSKTSDIMRAVPGARVIRNASGGFSLRLRRAQDCPPHVYVDGVRVILEPEVVGGGVLQGSRQRRSTRGSAMQPGAGIDELAASAIAAVEAYNSASQVPPEYNMTGAVCGVVLIWTGPRTM